MNKIFNQKSKIGLTVIFTAVILLAVLVLTNFIVGLLPKSATLLDTSEAKMYSVSANTKKQIAALNDDITIYLLTAGGEASLDDTGIHLNAFLKRLSSHSKNVTYTVVDLYTADNFLENRGIDSSTVTLNSIVVESKLRNRYIDSSELFYYYIDGIGKVSQSEAQLYQMYYGLTYSYYFGGENLIISSISYVTSTDLPLAIALTGHGETAISATLKNSFTTTGMGYSELASLSMIPGCDMLIINNPTSDITASEASLLSQYLSKGGKIMLITSPGTSSFVNLCSVIAEYGLGYEDGIIIDQTQGCYYQYPYYLVSTLASHEYTSGIDASVMLPFAHGISIDQVQGISTTQLLSSSAASYIIQPTATSTVKPEGQEEKSYAIGVISENEANGSAIIWMASEAFLDESANQVVSGGNFTCASAITARACDASVGGDTYTEPLALVTERLTVSFGSMAIIALLVVGIVPIGTIIFGVVYCQKRKRN